MKKFDICRKLSYTIQQLYAKASSVTLAQGTIGEWFHTSVGVCQGCLLSITLFDIFFEQIMDDAFEDHTSTVSIGGRAITNLHLTVGINGLAQKEEELT